MGYTHYWYQNSELNSEKFALAVTDARKILDAVRARGISLAGPLGEGLPEFSDVEIAFNGKAPQEDHESFVVERTVKSPETGRIPQTDEEGKLFNFCKTAYKPYDIAVTAVLLALQHHMGTEIRLSSDGGPEDWEPARMLVLDVCGYDEKFEVRA